VASYDKRPEAVAIAKVQELMVPPFRYLMADQTQLLKDFLRALIRKLEIHLFIN